MKQHVDRSGEEDILFNRVMNDNDTLPPTDRDTTVANACIPPRHPTSDDHVVAYTFGEFFASCVRRSGDSDIQVRALTIAEQYVLAMKETCSSMTVFEGCTSLICLSLKYSDDSRVFRSACQLACALFEATEGLDASHTHERSTQTQALNVVNELPRENSTASMSTLLEMFLSSSCCWSPSTANPRHKSSLNPPRSVNRSFLQWVRLLLQQSSTKRAFIRVCTSPDSLFSGSLASTANRMRLFRLLLSTEMDRSALQPVTFERVTTFCETVVLKSKRIEPLSVATTLSRLAHECLELLQPEADRDIGNTSAGVKRRMRIWQKRGVTMSKRASHAYDPLFRKHPLDAAVQEQFSDQLRQYYDANPRPSVLYRHNFAHCDAMDANSGEKMSFTKGSIQFHGVMESREASHSTASFHDRVVQQTRPFVFDVAAVSPDQDKAKSRDGATSTTTVESPFSVFRGTMERRNIVVRTGRTSDSPRTSSRLPNIPPSSDQESRGTPAADSLMAPRASFAVLQNDLHLPPLMSPDTSSTLSTEAAVDPQTPAVQAHKPLAAQVVEVPSGQSQTSRAPPRTTQHERQTGSPNKDACSLQ